MKLNKKQLIQLNKTKSDMLIISDGWALAHHDKDFSIMFKTDIPDFNLKLKDLKKIIKYLDDPEFNVEGDQLIIQDGNQTFKFDKLSLDVPDYEHPKGFKTIGSVSKSDLKSYGKFASRDEIRESMQCVRLSEEGMFSTNAHVLKFDRKKTFDGDVLIHHKATEMLLEDEYTVKVNEDGVGLLEGKYQRIVADNNSFRNSYPNILGVIPSRHKFVNSINVDKKEFHQAAKIISNFDNIGFMDVYRDGRISHNGPHTNNTDTYTYKKDISDCIEMDLDGDLPGDKILSFDSNTLCTILKDMGDDLNIRFANVNQATIMNDNYLLMQVQK